MKIYTRTGDAGETSLLAGGRISKADPRLDAYGTVDELNAFLGAMRAAWRGGAIDGELEAVQRDLFDLGALLATATPDERFPGPTADRVRTLEQSIDRMEAELTPLKNFILPGGTPAAASLHVARTVCRRAERAVVGLGSAEANIVRAVTYLNRLSDYLFVAARYANHTAGEADVTWEAV